MKWITMLKKYTEDKLKLQETLKQNSFIFGNLHNLIFLFCCSLETDQVKNGF